MIVDLVVYFTNRFEAVYSKSGIAHEDARNLAESFKKQIKAFFADYTFVKFVDGEKIIIAKDGIEYKCGVFADEGAIKIEGIPCQTDKDTQFNATPKIVLSTNDNQVNVAAKLSAHERLVNDIALRDLKNYTHRDKNSRLEEFEKNSDFINLALLEKVIISSKDIVLADECRLIYHKAPSLSSVMDGTIPTARSVVQIDKSKPSLEICWEYYIQNVRGFIVAQYITSIELEVDREKNGEIKYFNPFYQNGIYLGSIKHPYYGFDAKFYDNQVIEMLRGLDKRRLSEYQSLPEAAMSFGIMPDHHLTIDGKKKIISLDGTNKKYRKHSDADDIILSMFDEDREFGTLLDREKGISRVFGRKGGEK